MSEVERLVAKVAVDVPLPHLDRPFDYEIPPEMAADAQVGARVAVRFAGRPRMGYILDVTTTSSYEGKLAKLSRVVSPEPVLRTEQAELLRSVADYYCGTFADVARLAVPARHAATEASLKPNWPSPDTSVMPGGGLFNYPQGGTYLAALEAGRPTRAFWQADPLFTGTTPEWAQGVTQACVAVLRAGRGVCVIVPSARELAAAEAALRATLQPGCVAVLHSALGPSARYRNYLALSRGYARVVLGTRPAVYAPVADLGLIVVVDDGDDLHAEPHAPYPHSREVAAMRATQAGSGLLLVSHARSCEAQRWIDDGWMNPIEASASIRRSRAPIVRAANDSAQAQLREGAAAGARIPKAAFETITQGLTRGPVLIQVPRAGYLSYLVCDTCRESVRCTSCGGPMSLTRAATPSTAPRTLRCMWCGQEHSGFSCAHCGGQRLRAPVVGSARTAEEFAKIFPGYRLVDSAGGHVVERVGEQPALVVATVGAEPVADAGYAAAVLLDATLQLNRADLRAAEESLRRWMNAVALVRGAEAEGRVCIAGPSDASAIQALVRLDAAGFARHELTERSEAGLPPAVALVSVTGDSVAVADVVSRMRHEGGGGISNVPLDQQGNSIGRVQHPDPAGAAGRTTSPDVGSRGLATTTHNTRPPVEVLGPLPVREPGNSRALLRTSIGGLRPVVGRLKELLMERSAAKAVPVRVQVNPQAVE
jgi:primosomal protein N' (replication factor Y)